MQVEDTSKLDYEAGPDDTDKEPAQKQPEQPQQKQQQQQQQEEKEQAGDDEAAEEGQEGNGLNEDTEDRYEDSHFAPPTAPEEVRRLPSCAAHTAVTGALMLRLRI